MKMKTLMYLALMNLMSVMVETSNSIHEDRIFRTMKYNDIWKRALKTVNEENLAELGRMLKKLDKSELDLKHQKEAGEGYDEQTSKHLRNQLADVLDRFGVMDDDINRTDNSKISFTDHRLNRMWNQALKAGDYNANELSNFHEELQHMEKRIEEYHAYSAKVDEQEKRLNEVIENEATSNFVDHSDENSDSKKLKRMRQQLKHDYNHLQERVQILEETAQDRLANPEVIFTDGRVLDLWDRAQKSGKFSEDELLSVQEELRHFQNRISKLRHWERMSENLRKSVDDDGHQHMQDELNEANENVKIHKKYVKKYHATMMDRVYRHSEL